MYSNIIHVRKVDNSPGFDASNLQDLFSHLNINGYFLSYEIEIYRHYRREDLSSEFFTVYLILDEKVVEIREFSKHGDIRDS